jgi:hypothetical protein
VRALSTGQIRVDLLPTVQDNADLARFAGKFGYRMLLQPSVENSMWEAVLTRTTETFLRDDLAHLVFLTAMTDGKSPQAVLDDIAASLRKVHHVIVEAPPADQWPIGERHADGH